MNTLEKLYLLYTHTNFRSLLPGKQTPVDFDVLLFLWSTIPFSDQIVVEIGENRVVWRVK